MTTDGYMELDPQSLEFFQNLFNAIPSPIFIVDSDVVIQYMNRAASEAFRGDLEGFYRKRGGDALNCINSTRSPEGCGHATECRDCVIRNSVYEALSGRKAYRKKTAMTVLRNGKRNDIQLLVTASPFQDGDRVYSLLILEDISELLQLRSLLPICAWCRKVRNDDNYWQNIEEYFRSNLDIDFTHGICSECYSKQMQELNEEKGH
jgi:PAS domain-containing protein